MWLQAVRPLLIAKETQMSVSQVYRVCAGIKREGSRKPASRWNAHRRPSLQPPHKTTSRNSRRLIRRPSKNKFSFRAVKISYRIGRILDK